MHGRSRMAVDPRIPTVEVFGTHVLVLTLMLVLVLVLVLVSVLVVVLVLVSVCRL